MVRSKYGGCRTTATMCHGAATISRAAATQPKRSRRHSATSSRAPVAAKYNKTAAPGKTNAGNPFHRTPAPSAAPSVSAQARGRRTSPSNRRIAAYSATVTASVSAGSGMRIRENSHNPTALASAAPAQPPAARQRPAPEAQRHPAQRHASQRQRNPGRPVVHAEYGEARRHGPDLSRRLVEVDDPVEARRRPIARFQHPARDLGVGGVDVVHQRRRADQSPQEDGAGERQ